MPMISNAQPAGGWVGVAGIPTHFEWAWTAFDIFGPPISSSILIPADSTMYVTVPIFDAPIEQIGPPSHSWMIASRP